MNQNYSNGVSLHTAMHPTPAIKKYSQKCFSVISKTVHSSRQLTVTL